MRDAWVGLGAASLIASGGWITSQHAHLMAMFYGGFITFVYYATLHGIFSNNTLRNFLVGLGLLTLLSVLCLFEIRFSGLSNEHIRTRLILFVLSIPIAGFYLSPFGLQSMKFALRHVPLLKAPVIAFCWTMLTCFLPVLFGAPVLPVPMVVSRFLLILGLAILADIIDAFEDQGILITVPSAMGIGRARLIAIAFFIASDAMLYAGGWLPWFLCVTPLALVPALWVRPPLATWKVLLVDGVSVFYFPLMYMIG